MRMPASLPAQLSFRIFAALAASACLCSCILGHPLVGVTGESDEEEVDPSALALLGLAGIAAGDAACTPTLLGGSVTGCPLSLSGAVSTPYGPAEGTTSSGDTDATGNAARFSGPGSITTDGTQL